ncbi:MAG TPA: hypothetical protein VL001_05960 [Candidimonas sp.]|nr:hypothetical protein [Candidimonas sp.]
MTAGEWIVVALFGVGLLCSASLFWWLLRIVKRDRRKDTAGADAQSADASTKLR